MHFHWPSPPPSPHIDPLIPQPHMVGLPWNFIHMLCYIPGIYVPTCSLWTALLLPIFYFCHSTILAYCFLHIFLPPWPNHRISFVLCLCTVPLSRSPIAFLIRAWDPLCYSYQCLHTNTPTVLDQGNTIQIRYHHWIEVNYRFPTHFRSWDLTKNWGRYGGRSAGCTIWDALDRRFPSEIGA